MVRPCNKRNNNRREEGRRNNSRSRSLKTNQFKLRFDEAGEVIYIAVAMFANLLTYRWRLKYKIETISKWTTVKNKKISSR